MGIENLVSISTLHMTFVVVKLGIVLAMEQIPKCITWKSVKSKIQKKIFFHK